MVSGGRDSCNITLFIAVLCPDCLHDRESAKVKGALEIIEGGGVTAGKSESPRKKKKGGEVGLG